MRQLVTRTATGSRRPDDGKGSTVLTGVSCPAVDDCVAVGYYQPLPHPLSSTTPPPRRPVVETFTGRGWALDPVPPAPSNSILLAASCPSKTTCTAVGYTTSKSRTVALAASFAEGKWAFVPVAMPPGLSATLNSVACESPSSCVAVGNTSTTGTDPISRPLIEVLAAGKWTTVPLPTPAGGPGVLYAVACPAATSCVAVGESTTSHSPSSALVLSSSGSQWTTNAAALRVTGENSLVAVACASPTDCLVGGNSATTLGSAPQMLLAQIVGGGWQQIDVPAFAGFLTGMSCPSTTRCFVVGSTGTNLDQRTLLATVSEGVWNTLSSPTP
jgi:hypothetical protein